MSLFIELEQTIHNYGDPVRIVVSYEDHSDSCSAAMYGGEVDIMLFACVDPPINHLPFIKNGVLNIS